MPWCVSAYEVEYIFEYMFWFENHLDMKPGQLIDIAVENILHALKGWVLNPGHFWVLNLP